MMFLSIAILVAPLGFTQNIDDPISSVGVVINHIPAQLDRFIGSPSIVCLPSGDYIASHDEFGATSTEFKTAITRIYRSSDKGNSWKRIAQINGQFWSNLFYHNNALYIIGTNKHHGNLIVRRSTDSGQSWTTPYNASTGLILEGEYHTAATPILVHNGRIWRAVEYATYKTNHWGERYSAMMISVPVDSDLLDARNWRRTNILSYDSTYLNNNFKAWLEGNAVADRDGRVIDILRVHVPKGHREVAAIVNISQDGERATFDPSNFVYVNGASKKFTIRYDAKSDKYWSIMNIVPDSLSASEPNKIRNIAALVSSINLKEWRQERVLLSCADYEKVGFQYIDWQFDGDDIIFVSRTAWQDKTGGAKNSHDANYITFHRVETFRK